MITKYDCYAMWTWKITHKIKVYRQTDLKQYGLHDYRMWAIFAMHSAKSDIKVIRTCVTTDHT